MLARGLKVCHARRIQRGGRKGGHRSREHDAKGPSARMLLLNSSAAGISIGDKEELARHILDL